MDIHDKTPPICKVCNTKAIIADAGALTSIPYFYCRPCKKELTDTGWYVQIIENDSAFQDLEEYFSEFDEKLLKEEEEEAAKKRKDLQDFWFSGADSTDFYPHPKRK